MRIIARRALLGLVLCALMGAILSPACLAEADANFPLRRGTEGILVERLQQNLIRLGFLYGLPDGIMGSATAAAVSEAQKAWGLESSGVVDAAFFDTLERDHAPVSETELTGGQRGDAVTRLQRVLLLKGYLQTVDGHFGTETKQAVSAFQARNNLPETGKADAQTQDVLFGETAVSAETPPNPLLVYVSTAAQRVFVYAWKDGAYRVCVRQMRCTTGMSASATPRGIYKTQGNLGEWYYFGAFNVWARYAIRIKGPYLFHSVLYSRKSEQSIQSISVANLGSRASHGCVRLGPSDAKWLYENNKKGFNTIVY